MALKKNWDSFYSKGTKWVGRENPSWKFSTVEVLCVWKISSFSLFDMILVTLADNIVEIFSKTRPLLEKFGSVNYQKIPKNATII